MSSRVPGSLPFAKQSLLDTLVEFLRAAFAEHAQVGVQAYPVSQTGEADAVIEIHSGRDVLHIAVDVLGDAYPRDIRNAIWKLDAYRSGVVKPKNLIRLVAANSLSPGAKATLVRHGYGYFDTNGSLYLRARRWLINIERGAAPPARAKSQALFTEAREGVVHALLNHANRWLNGQELARLCGASPYTCSVVLQELERLEWCESRGGGPTKRRRLTKPGQLLDAWAERWVSRKQATSRWYAFVADPRTLLAQLGERIERADFNAPWAFTGAAAANLYAPLLTSTDTVEIIVPPGFSKVLAEGLQLKPASSGSNVSILEREGASLLFRQAHAEPSAYHASPVVLYLDLLDGRGRNRELANQVRQRLEAAWQVN